MTLLRRSRSTSSRWRQMNSLLLFHRRGAPSSPRRLLPLDGLAICVGVGCGPAGLIWTGGGPCGFKVGGGAAGFGVGCGRDDVAVAAGISGLALGLGTGTVSFGGWLVGFGPSGFAT